MSDSQAVQPADPPVENPGGPIPEQGRPPRRRRRDLATSLIHELTSDLWRKLLAVGLAILLWHWLDGKVTEHETLRLALVAADSGSKERDYGPASSDQLQVRLPLRRFAITEYRDAITGKELDRRVVTLELAGAKNLIERLRGSVGFAVYLNVSDVPASGSFTQQIRVEDLRASDPDFQPLIADARMTPTRVEVELQHVEKTVIALTHKAVSVRASSDRQRDLGARLVVEDATFEPATIEIYGPTVAIEQLQKRRRIFDFGFGTASIDTDRVTGELSLIEFPGSDQLRFLAGQPKASYPLRPEYQEFVLSVPVLIDAQALPERDRNQFAATESVAEVSLLATSSLETLLADKSRTELDRWALQTARLIATLEGAEPAAEMTIIEPLFILLDRTYRPDIDYRVVSPPPIRIERITDK